MTLMMVAIVFMMVARVGSSIFIGGGAHPHSAGGGGEAWFPT